MLIKRLHQLLIPPDGKLPRRQLIFWFSLSLTFAAIFSLVGLQQAFSAPYVVQDDARQHVFWMQRFLDPTLFPGDAIADYFQSIAPAGYRAIYRLAATIGIEPLLFNKLLPLVLSLVTAAYAFGVCLQLLPVPIAGFVGSLLLSQNLWLHDDLVSATARAFLYPIFLAFLYYLLRREAQPFWWKSLLPCLITIALQGLFYPHYVFIMSGALILRLFVWDGRLRFSRDRQHYLFCIVGLAVALGVMLPYALDISDSGGPISAALARTMPEFQDGGRSEFFTENPWHFWLTAQRSGALIWIMPLCVVAPGLLVAELLLPNRFPLIQQARKLSILAQVELVSLFMFFAAHAVLFKLYLPARYSQNSLLILTPLAAAVAIPVAIDTLFRWAEQPNNATPRRNGAIALTLGLTLLLILSPLIYEFPDTRYKTGSSPGLYQFLAQQPKDTLIAGLSPETDNVPTFSRRSVLVSREASIPYQMGYYNELRQRMADQLVAQYSLDLATVQDFIRRYEIDFWLVDRAYLRTPKPRQGGDRLINDWLQQFQPTYDEAVENFRQGNIPALARLVEPCTAFKNRRLVVLETACVLQSNPKQAGKLE
jgi:hypothetical protein